MLIQFSKQIFVRQGKIHPGVDRLDTTKETPSLVMQPNVK
jgi:hypothetical protein